MLFAPHRFFLYYTSDARFARFCFIGFVSVRASVNSLPGLSDAGGDRLNDEHRVAEREQAVFLLDCVLVGGHDVLARRECAHEHHERRPRHVEEMCIRDRHRLAFHPPFERPDQKSAP